MSPTVQTISPLDSCVLCGWRGIWNDAESAAREAQTCKNCRAGLRYRNQAASIVTHLGRGRYANLRDLSRDPILSGRSRIYEIALGGPFIKYFSVFDNYTRSYFWPNVPLGETKDGVRCEDLTKLTFDSEAFDIVISSDVMEHVFDYELAFSEIFRVLAPGGAHIFTVPIVWPMPASTIKRAEQVGQDVVHHLEPRFHRGGDGTPSLVCTDFGFDLLELLESIGYEAWFERPSMMRAPGYADTVVISRRPRMQSARLRAEKGSVSKLKRGSRKKSA